MSPASGRTRRLRRVVMEGVSAIVSVRNHQRQLPRFFANLQQCEVLEVLVCDCGSTDESAIIARQEGAHVFRAGGDLCDDLNDAAGHARGSALWFLAPACLPPPLAGPFIIDALAMREVAAGWFRQAPLRGGVSAWARAWWRNLGARYWRRVALEHGPFISQGTFMRLGGCKARDWPVGELLGEVTSDHGLFLMPDPIQLQHSRSR